MMSTDLSGLMNTDQCSSILIQTVIIIADTVVATFFWTDLISLLLDDIRERTLGVPNILRTRRHTKRPVNLRNGFTKCFEVQLSFVNYMPFAFCHF